MELTWIRFLLLISLVSIGCNREYDGDRSAYADTHAKLRNIAEVLHEFEARRNLKQYRSFEDAFDDWCKRSIIKASTRHLRFDAWDRPFEWKVRAVEGKTIIRVNSKGPDGISQMGEGDDIFMEFQIGDDGIISYKIIHPKKK